jgi:hypothetical protein
VAEVLAGRALSPDVAFGNGSVMTDRDVQLALWMIYELSYRGFDDVDPALEWDPRLVGLRVALETAVEQELRAATRGRVHDELTDQGDIGDLLLRMVETERGPQLASYLRRDATLEQMRDYLRERSVQQLKESDPQAFLLPRLRGAAKVALAELQYDEFGGGRPERLHQELYAHTLRAAGLDPAYGAYVGDVSAISLASSNVMSMFGLNRRLLAAGLGHFAAFEASSSAPSRRVAAGLERLGLAEAAPYFDEHVEADAVHEQVAARDICGSFLAEEPGARADVVFGAACCLYLDHLSAAELLARWQPDVTEQPDERSARARRQAAEPPDSPELEPELAS